MGHDRGSESKSQPTLVILFPDDWAIYSPTLTRLVDRLAPYFDVKAFVLDTGRFDLSSLGADRYVRVRCPKSLAWALRKLGLFRITRSLLLAKHAFAARHVRHLVAVDGDGALAAMLVGRSRFHFLSLEIRRHAFLRRAIPRRLQSIVIQTEDRLRFQFDSRSIAGVPIFYVQNAPSVPTVAPPSRLPVSREKGLKLVFMGNAIPAHGLEPMLALLRSLPESTLTLQGNVPDGSWRIIKASYADLLAEKRILVPDEFMAEEQLSDFLSQFDVGLCLYSLRGMQRYDFNYVSAPSGKMFNYFAAGIPVLGSDLLGLQPVKEHGAGMLVRDNSVEELSVAAEKIAADMDRYRDAARAAARHYDFAAATAPWLDYLRDAG